MLCIVVQWCKIYVHEHVFMSNEVLYWEAYAMINHFMMQYNRIIPMQTRMYALSTTIKSRVYRVPKIVKQTGLGGQ